MTHSRRPPQASNADTSDFSLSFKRVREVLGSRFLIPAYQRGYRWTELEVRALLEDLEEFRKDAAGGVYCLQPVVVKPRADEGGSVHEVIDGQQRLTTLYLLICHLREETAGTPYELSYETRKETCGELMRRFAAKESESSERHDNVDFHHMYEAYRTIEGWFADRSPEERAEYLKCVLERAGVVWYALAEERQEEAEEAFTRLNAGKIPLTDAELVRALFLRAPPGGSVDEERVRERIAREWDEIERTLHLPSFWAFVRKDAVPLDNRIQLLLKDSGGLSESKDQPKAFPHYRSRFEKGSGILPEDDWAVIHADFRELQEWHADKTSFHLVGFLVQQGRSLDFIRSLRRRRKSEFGGALRRAIFQQVFEADPATMSRTDVHGAVEAKLQSLSYGEKEVRAVLLLFNLATLLLSPDPYLRFPFDLYLDQEWDVEHVHSVASQIPSGEEAQRAWLKMVLDHVPATETQRARELLDAPIWEKTAFEVLFFDITKSVKDAAAVENSIGNLVLLDQNTNRSYKNALFPIKRQRILELDKGGNFVPQCTRNVFLKSYSQKVDQMLQWGTTDRDDYRNAMTDVLTGLFAPKEAMP